MRRGAFVLIAAAAAPAAAIASPIAVKVVEVAGGVAFVSPGHAAGLVTGTSVRLGDHDFTVVEVTQKSAAVRIDDAAIAIGATGIADADPAAAASSGALAKPRALADFRDQWPDSIAPASSQHPDAVALAGAGGRGQRTQLEVIGTMFGGADSSGTSGQGEARVISSFQVTSDRPLSGDVDVAGRAFTSGWNGEQNTPWYVRAAELRYGDTTDPALMIGRLRYAATSLGMLDGGRAAAHVGDFELAAFGGLVPDPVSGKPSTDASRFGAEAVWDRASSPWQPRVAVTASGSTWQSQLDERRLSIAASASHGSTWLDAWADAQQFPAGNPFNAPSVEITGAGASAAWRDHGEHLGLDVTFLRPEQSLRLLAAVPALWVCTRAPLPGNVAESCLGGDDWYAATGSAGLRRDRWSVDAVGSLGATQGGATVTRDASGYVRGELRGKLLRAIAAISGGRSGFVDFVAPEIGVGVTPSRRFDATLSYRPERLDYTAATGAIVMQSLVVDLHYAASAALDFAVSAVGSVGSSSAAGADPNSLQLIGTVAWRPIK